MTVPIVLPRLPEGGGLEGLGPLAAVWVVAVLAYWFGGNATAAWLLVRASVGEPGVVRNRLRVLAVAAFGLGLVLVGSALVGDDNPDVLTAAEIVTDLLSAGLGILFLVGFAPPNLLKAAWRERDERRLYEAAVGLMGAQHPDDVAGVVVPGRGPCWGRPASPCEPPAARSWPTPAATPRTCAPSARCATGPSATPTSRWSWHRRCPSSAPTRPSTWTVWHCSRSSRWTGCGCWSPSGRHGTTSSGSTPSSSPSSTPPPTTSRTR